MKGGGTTFEDGVVNRAPFSWQVGSLLEGAHSPADIRDEDFLRDIRACVELLIITNRGFVYWNHAINNDNVVLITLMGLAGVGYGGCYSFRS